jgi:hypothetical protein
MKLFNSETAEAEVVGYILILSITILGISMIALYGVPAIYSMEDMANVKNVEQSFTVLDSRASRLTLGESPLQVTNINLGGGTLTVEPNSTKNPSFIFVNSSNFNVTIPMGRVKYTLGDRIVAYEGGGIWAQYAGGGTVMLSPPEFHYDGVTLTLPSIDINGNSSVGGKGTAVVSFKKNATLVLYPNTSRPDWINRTNPVIYNTGTGKVFVNVTSEYYLAWYDFAKSLGYTTVSINYTTHTTSMELSVVPSWLGENTSIRDPLNFRGLPGDTTPLDNFSFKIYDKSGSNFNGNSFHWDIRAKSGNNQSLIFYIKGTDLTIGYQDNGYNPPAETWGPTVSYPIKHDGGGDYIYVDLLDNNSYLNYNDLTVGDDSGGTQNGNGCTIDKIKKTDFSDLDFSWDNIIISKTNANRTQSLYNITQHYFWKMAQGGDFSFSKCVTGSSGSPGPESTMLIDYPATGSLTYLHITDNRADVGIS